MIFLAEFQTQRKVLSVARRNANTKKTKTMIAAFNTDTQLLQNYREHRAANNPTGMGCVRLYSNGSITSGMSEIARFENAKDAAKALKAAGYRKGDGDKHSTVYYV